MFHDGVVDGFAAAFGEQRLIDAQEVHIFLASVEGGTTVLKDVGGVGGEFVQVVAGPYQEDPAVPQVVATVEIALGVFGVRFLDEAVHPKALAESVAAADIAVAGVCAGGGDAEGHQLALFDQ